MRLSTLIKNLESFDFKKERDTIVENKKEALNDLLAEQFASGKDSQGKAIQLLNNAQDNYGYRPFTIHKKQTEGIGLGKITNRITLYQSGALYKKLQTKIEGERFDTYSSVPYWSVIVASIQTNAVKLNEDNRRTFAESFVIPGIQQAFSKKVLKR